MQPAHILLFGIRDVYHDQVSMVLLNPAIIPVAPTGGQTIFLAHMANQGSPQYWYQLKSTFIVGIQSFFPIIFLFFYDFLLI